MSKYLVKSAYLQKVECATESIVYHSLFGYPLILNNDAIDLLDCFNQKQDANRFSEKSGYEDAQALISLFESSYFLVKPDMDERQVLKDRILSAYTPSIFNGTSIEYLSLITSEECNFACSYCISNSMISSSHRKYKRKRIMSFRTAKKAVDIFLSIMKKSNKKKAYVNFGGGEPIINWPVINSVLEYCREKYGDQFEFSFTVNTNGSLITNEIAKSINEYGVEVALSLDGLQFSNDKVRITKEGKGTFTSIVNAMDRLKKCGYKLGGFSTTISEANFNSTNEDLVYFAAEKGFKDLRLDLDVIHLQNIPISEAIDKLLLLKRKAAECNLAVTGFWERPVESLNSSILEKHIAFCGGVAGRSMCVSPTEEIFVCGYSATKIADLTCKEDVINSNIYHNIVNRRFVGQIERCLGCPIEGQCMGGCFITEEFGKLNENVAMRYNCQLYKAMTVELLKDALKEASAS